MGKLHLFHGLHGAGLGINKALQDLGRIGRTIGDAPDVQHQFVLVAEFGDDAGRAAFAVLLRGGDGFG